MLLLMIGFLLKVIRVNFLSLIGTTMPTQYQFMMSLVNLRRDRLSNINFKEHFDYCFHWVINCMYDFDFNFQLVVVGVLSFDYLRIQVNSQDFKIEIN